MSKKKKDFKELIQYVPYQKCPKCDGQGAVSKPPYIAGDVFEWSSTSLSHTCDVCNGAKIILQGVINN